MELKKTEICQLTAKASSTSQDLEAMNSKLSEAGMFILWSSIAYFLSHSKVLSEKGAATMAECIEKSMSDLDDFYRGTMIRMNEKLIHMEQRLVFATNRSCGIFAA